MHDKDSTKKKRKKEKAPLLDNGDEPSNTIQDDESLEGKQRKRQCWCCGWRGWAACGGVCLLLLGGLLAVMILVVLPLLAQHMVDGSSVKFNKLTLMHPAEDSVYMTATATLHAKGAKQYKASIESTRMDVSRNGKRIGHTNTPKIKMHGGSATINFAHSFIVDDVNQFNEFSYALMRNDTVTWRMKARITVNVHIGSLSLVVRDINFDKETTLPAMGGLSNVTLNVFNLLLINGTAVGQIFVTIYNPSVVSILPVGDLQLLLYFDGAQMGSLTVSNASLARGDNYLPMEGAICPSDFDKSNILFTNYLTGKPSLLSTVAPQNASSIALYNGGLEGFTLSVTLDGLQFGLVNAGYITLNASALLEGLEKGLIIAPTSLLLKNVLTAPISLVGVALHVLYRDIVVGGLFTKLDPPVVANPNTLTLSRPLPIELLPTTSNLRDLIEALGSELLSGVVVLGINGTFFMQTGQIFANPAYTQEGIHICNQFSKAQCGM